MYHPDPNLLVGDATFASDENVSMHQSEHFVRFSLVYSAASYKTRGFFWYIVPASIAILSRLKETQKSRSPCGGALPAPKVSGHGLRPSEL